MNKITYINKEFPDQPREREYGNKEYKWRIVPKDKKKRNFKSNKLASQLMYRLYEGDGKAVYILGILDNGIAIGLNQDEIYDNLEMFENITNIINCNIKNIRLYNKNKGYIATIRCNKNI